MNLTKTQRDTLACLGDPSVVHMSAYSIGCSLATLRALERRQLTVSLQGSGSMFFPRNAQWRITHAGRAALAQESKP